MTNNEYHQCDISNISGGTFIITGVGVRWYRKWTGTWRARRAYNPYNKPCSNPSCPLHKPTSSRPLTTPARIENIAVLAGPSDPPPLSRPCPSFAASHLHSNLWRNQAGVQFCRLHPKGENLSFSTRDSSTPHLKHCSTHADCSL